MERETRGRREHKQNKQTTRTSRKSTLSLIVLFYSLFRLFTLLYAQADKPTSTPMSNSQCYPNVVGTKKNTPQPVGAFSFFPILVRILLGQWDFNSSCLRTNNSKSVYFS
eukprot:m.62445 g.62445  ORF g.62445 m.62445 type:complete len:110 (-) comp8031_c0_seq1:741-1070(-)